MVDVADRARPVRLGDARRGESVEFAGFRSSNIADQVRRRLSTLEPTDPSIGHPELKPKSASAFVTFDGHLVFSKFALIHSMSKRLPIN